MNEKEFQKILPKIKRILTFVIEDPHSDFYRRKYSNLNIDPEAIQTYADFCCIPYLTKDEILSIPFDKRSFADGKEIIRYGISSGSTSQNKPLILPHLVINKQEDGVGSHDEVFIKSLGVKKILGLLPVNSMIQKIQLGGKLAIPIIQIELNKMDLAVNLTMETGLEGIISAPTILYIFTEKLRATSFDRNIIKWISIGTEVCTVQKLEYFKKYYPKAFIEIRYGNSEAGANIGYRCKFLEQKELNPQIFHPNDMNLIEITPDENLNSNTGEVVFTHLYKEAFPLIRYKTGDFATETESSCECGQKRTMTTHGKHAFDVLKTSGVIIHSQAITNALEAVNKHIELEFEMHVYEESFNDKIRTRLVLKLKPKIDRESEQRVASVIEKNLYLSQDKIMTDLVKEGLFYPLMVEYVTSFETAPKQKHIISHL